MASPFSQSPWIHAPTPQAIAARLREYADMIDSEGSTVDRVLLVVPVGDRIFDYPIGTERDYNTDSLARAKAMLDKDGLTAGLMAVSFKVSVLGGGGAIWAETVRRVNALEAAAHASIAAGVVLSELVDAAMACKPQRA